MSLQPFQQAAQGSSGALGTSGAVSQSGVVGSSQAIDTQQIQDQNNLAAITAAQLQQAEQDQKKPQPDKSKGWSLTNPFQDIGQIWHDVETHTIAPVFHATNWLFTNLIKRPYTTIALYSAHNEYQASQDTQIGHGRKALCGPRRGTSRRISAPAVLQFWLPTISSLLARLSPSGHQVIR